MIDISDYKVATPLDPDIKEEKVEPKVKVKRKSGEGRRLTDAERYEIIKIIEEPGRPSLRQIARDFEIGEKTVRNIRNQKDIIKTRVAKATNPEQLQVRRINKKKDGAVLIRTPRRMKVAKNGDPQQQFQPTTDDHHNIQYESRPVEASFVAVVTATLHGLAETLEQNPSLSLGEDVRANFAVAVERALNATSQCH